MVFKVPYNGLECCAFFVGDQSFFISTSNNK
jgi:hypothetical protein